VITILVADDDQASRTLLAKFLKRAGYAVVEAADGLQAVAGVGDADAMLLDIMMPGLDGWDVFTVVRARRPDLPVLFVTALTAAEHEIRGLRLGVDDYVAKPVDLEVLQLRLEAVLKRHGVTDRRRFGAMRIDLERRQVVVDDETVGLTRTEFDLLAALSAQPGRVFTRAELLDRVWGPAYNGIDRTVDVRVAGLRSKLGDDDQEPRYIATVRGIGYRFVHHDGG
jgi:two-component system, OmpR family, alkaline phosphatase synthesis response regulator PhoP